MYRYLTFEDEAKLRAKMKDKLNGVLEDVVILALYTGMRLAEILSLKWSHINLSQKTLTVEGKMYVMKTIALSEAAFFIMKRRAETSDMSGYVFTNKKGDVIKASRLMREFRLAVAESGIHHFPLS